MNPRMHMMEPTVRLRSLMDTTTSIFMCLLIFVARGAVTVWPLGGHLNRTYCVLAILACMTGIFTNITAKKLVLPRRSN
jgi:hypothetical protein